MKVLSASEAISPAIERTKQYLFRPFKWRTFLKLSLVAVLTEGGGTNLNFNFPGFGSHSHDSGSVTSNSVASTVQNSPHFWIALILLIVALAIPLGIYLCYLITRLRFAYFHCLVHQTKEIRPAWRLYGEQAMRYFLFSLLVGLIFLVILAVVALPFVFAFIHLYRSIGPGGQFPIGSFILLLLPLIGIVLIFCLVGWGVEVIMNDFLLPHIALENSTVREAWAAVRVRIGAEKRSFAVYALLRLLLRMVASIGALLIAIIPMLIVIVILAVLIVGFNVMLSNATGFAAVLLVLLDILFGLIGVGILLFVGITLGGPVATWLRNYALLFYGGRYQALGDILSPPLPTAPSTPEVA